MKMKYLRMMNIHVDAHNFYRVFGEHMAQKCYNPLCRLQINRLHTLDISRQYILFYK